MGPTPTPKEPLKHPLFKTNSPENLKGSKCILKGCTTTFNGERPSDSFKKHLHDRGVVGEKNKEDVLAIAHLKLWKEWKKSLGTLFFN